MIASKLILQVKQGFNFVKPVYYLSCSDLPLYNFIKVLVTNDFSYLKISGNPSQSNLEDAWETIFSEYMALSDNTQQNHLLTLLKEIATLNNKLILIQSIVNQLAVKHHPELVKQLQSFGFRYKYNPENLDQYEKELKLTISQAKSILVRVDQRKRDLNNMKSEGEVSEADYDMLLSELSKFQGYRLNSKEITVSEFLAIVNRFKKENKPNGKRGKN